MKLQNLISGPGLLLPLLFILCGLSHLSAQEATVVYPSPIGYDTTVTVTIRLNNLPLLTQPLNVTFLAPSDFYSDFRADSIKIINDSTLTVRLYTGTTIDNNTYHFLLSFADTNVITANGIKISATKLLLNWTFPRRGYTKKYLFRARPHVTTHFEEDSILSITCYDSMGNITQDIVFDSVSMLPGNNFTAHIMVKETVRPGKYKIVVMACKNGTLTSYFTLSAPMFDIFGAARGSVIKGITYSDRNYFTLFQKGTPNTIKIYRNGMLSSDIMIDSAKAASEEKLALYGKVSANAQFGNYDLVIQNAYDTLSVVFTVFKPKTQQMNRLVYRGDSSTSFISTVFAHLTKGITTLSLLNPVDSAFMQISNLTIANDNTCNFLLKVDPLARLGAYYIKLTNSFDTISIVDSFFIQKGRITMNSDRTIYSESKTVVELQGTHTLFTHATPSLRAIPSLSGTTTIDSISVLSDTTLRLWLTADPISNGWVGLSFYSTIDDSISIDNFLVIMRPQAGFANKESILMGLKDTVTLSIEGSFTHFKRIKNMQFSYLISDTILKYDSNKIKILHYTAHSDTSLSVTICTNEDSLYEPNAFNLSLFDSLSGELRLPYTVSFTSPVMKGYFRDRLKKQASDTLWVPLVYFSESQIANIDSILFQDLGTATNALAVTGYSYKSQGTQRGILLNLEMTKAVKSTDYCNLKIIWNFNTSSFTLSDWLNINAPGFVSGSSRYLTKDSVTHCSIVFDGLFEDSVMISTDNKIKITHVQIQDDTVTFDAEPITTGFLNYDITTPNEGVIYSGEFVVRAQVGLTDVSLSSSFELYPIPAQHTIFIQSTGNTTIQSIDIYDMLGKSLTYDESGTGIQNINTAGLSPGAYSMHIHTNKGTVVKKFLKN